ncbi:MAG: PEP-utilizing protein [Gammaproteobacteria bacterium]|nr:PEP-utilizing protein [Gammaproteobacteria bacterium]
MADESKIIKQFLGDEDFPIDWDNEGEKGLFWVYDDLHCPQPLSPMYFDIGGWWLTCDHMFRRFGTPFASDWIAKNVNGYLYTAAVPADPDFKVESMEYSNVYYPRVPKDDPEYASKIGAYLGAVLPTYGQNFADWWRDRLVPEMRRNFDYLEDRIDRWEEIPLMEWATILEDAMDIHDRHWKIHWMLNFAQLSATLNLQAVMEEVRGEADPVLLGRLQNSAEDRNWDSIGALWKMKEEIKGDAELSEMFSRDTGTEVLEALEASERGQKFIAERLKPYQREFGWHAVWSHEFIFATRFERAQPVLEVIKGYLETDYDYPSTVKHLAEDIAAASAEILEGLEGEALEKMKAANEINLKMAPLTPDHHFYIDQGSNAHLRLVLVCIGRHLVKMGVLDEADDVIYLKYNELRYFLGDPENFDARSIVATRKAEREAAYTVRPKDWIGTATESQLEFPYLGLWGFPDRLYMEQPEAEDQIAGLAASPGVYQGTAKVVLSVDEFDLVNKGDILVCQMTNPAWVTLFTKISGLVTDAGGLTSHPAVLAREFGIPAVIGTSVATEKIRTGDRLRVNGSTGVVEILAEGDKEGDVIGSDLFKT